MGSGPWAHGSLLTAQGSDNVFDFLKKKISGFINKITGKEEQKQEEKKLEAVSQKPEAISTVPEAKQEIREEKPEEKPQEPPKIQEGPKPPEKRTEKPPEKKIEKPTEIKVEKKPKPLSQKPPAKGQMPKVKETEIKPEPKIIEPKIEKKVEIKPVEHKKIEVTPEIKTGVLPEAVSQEPTAKSQQPEMKPKEREVKVGILSHLKSIFTGEIEIGKNDVREMLDSLELELIESDVAMEVAETIKQELEEKLVGKKIKKGELNNFIKSVIKEALLSIISSDKIFDIVDVIRTYQKPVKILFLGTNGGGKTTTIAKIAKMLMQHGNKVVLAAADTFRAAAIEQLSLHADRLGIKIIKREYGGDPTAVAYDAISYASAHDIDIVLIDTAGRQETNFNLINEMKKMQRVIQPHLKIYIGESIAGNAIISQVSEFNSGIGVDAVILTKLDCDAKGGTVLSISKVTGIPIIYLGTGQKYEDLEKFDAHAIVDRILS